LPVIENINFIPAIPQKLSAISKMGFWRRDQLILRFEDRWWIDALGKDLAKWTLMLSHEEIRNMVELNIQI